MNWILKDAIEIAACGALIFVVFLVLPVALLNPENRAAFINEVRSAL